MVKPNIWGKGALFCYSGWDGECVPPRAMCGRLLGDFIGVDFDDHDVQLVMRVRRVRDWRFDVVASDLIAGRLDGGQEFCMVFAAQNVVLGRCPTDRMTPVLHGDLLEKQQHTSCAVYAKHGAAYALALVTSAENETRFALVREQNPMDAAQLALQWAKDGDVAAAKARCEAYFDRLPAPLAERAGAAVTLAKCYSIMKSQVYTPYGRFAQRWTTPDRLPHRHLWLWDSVFHSFGNVYVDPQLAKDSLLSVLDGQREDGFVPHMILPDMVSDVTQPPVLAWGFLTLYEKTGKRDLLESVWKSLRRYLAWNEQHRAGSVDGLFSWFVDPNDPNCRCGESGMDNSPRFDGERHLNCVDFSCFMANEMRCMQTIATLLGDAEAESAYANRYREISAAIETHLFDERDNRYYDRSVKDGSWVRVAAVSSFLPLFAGVCSQERAALLLEDLFNPATFGTTVGVPSVAVSDATFGSDMWRGPVWINYNYMIILGLDAYGYRDAARALCEATLTAIETWYERSGCLYEYYDSTGVRSPAELPRKGLPLCPADDMVRYPAVRDYGWTAALYVALCFWREKRS